MDSLEAGFYDDIIAAELRLKKGIQFKTSKYEELIDLPMDELDRHGCPALVIASSRSFGHSDERAIVLASIVQYIFVADRVHGLVQDGQTEQTQYPVLVGDYLYGKFFLDLTRHHLDHMLKPLAQAIATMSEGSIARWIAAKEQKSLSLEQDLQIMAQERASFTQLIIWLGAELANAPTDLKGLFESFGYQLGLAWAAYTNKMKASVIGDLLKKARQALEDLENKASANLPFLDELYHFFEKNFHLT